MIPKEAMNGRPLSPEDSEAINDALSFLRKAMVKIYESALDHKIALPWQVEATDGDGDVIARLGKSLRLKIHMLIV
jgi:hypothetical protein